MLTEHDVVILEKWRAVRAAASDAHAKLDAHVSKPEHSMGDLIAACDVAIAELEAKASSPDLE